MKTINSFRSKLLVLTLALMASVSSFAYDFTFGNDFHIDGFGYKIISVNTPDDGEGYVSLIEIADCKKDVVIPKYVSYGDRGFHVTTFGIGSVVFTNDASSVVESITIPKTTSVINKNALAGCPNLKTVVVDSENPYYDSRENCNAIITTSQNPYFTPNTLIAGCKTTIIPNSVVEIGENAFYDCESLETITIPNSVTKIGKSTFNACSTLSSITLSENLTEIGNWAFDDCNNLKEVICYAPQPPTISKYTFSDISPTVYVPENTVTIYQNAPYWMTFDIQPINAGPFNEKLLGTWRVVGGNEIISISDSIIVFIGLTQKYTASATQLTVERLWIPEEKSYRWANCNYTLSNDTLWIDNFMPLLVATYPPTFGPITLVKVKHEDLFPTLWGLRRTHTIEMYDYAPNDSKRSGGYPLSFAPVKDTIINGKTYLQFSDNLHELGYSLFFLREENNKVLIYSSILQDDLVLYDYTLEVGDSLYTIEGYDWFDDVNITKLKKTKDAYVVTDVSTITLSDGIERKKWSLYKGYTPLEYVEGIGCFGENLSWPGDFFRLITNYPYIAESVGDHLVCVSKNGQLLYSMTKDEMNSFTWTCECLSEKDTTYYKSKWCDTWNVLELKYRYSSYTTKEDFETWRYYLAQDTIINNYTYTAVTRQTTKVPEGVYPFTIPEPEYVAAVRFTDDRKVYIYYDNTEYLLYDFNVQPGDELTVFAGINHYHSHHTNTIRVDEVERYPGIYPFGTEISLSVFPDFYGDERPACFGVTKWVEGVGDLCGFITGADCGLSEYQTALLCAYKDGNTEYTTEYEEYAEYGCEYNSGENKEYILTLPGLQRTVCNEYCGETEEDNSANNTYKQTFDSIFFENDKPYILCNGYLLREEDNKIFLYSQSLNKDIVLYDFTLEVGDSLPAYIKDFDGTMYSDDTLVVTDISSVTILDGKEYKKWTFDNGMEYVEGIGMYGGHRNGNFFGLIQEIVVPCHTGTHLVCVSKNNKLLYQMDPVKMDELGAECLCEYNSGPKKDNAKNGKIGGRPTPTQWNMLEVETKEMDGTPTILRAETFSYTLENDSIVTNGKIFYQLARQSTKDTAITKSFVGALHFGEDEDNRVYFLRDGVEYVLYDFTAEIGDTVEIFAGINNYPQETTYTHVVVDKDTTEDGACRMFLEVVFPDETTTTTNAEKVWLAGLGSIDGIVHNTATRTSDAHAAPARSAYSSDTQTSVMLCAWREDSCLYTTNHPEYDTFGCVYNQDPTTVENLTSPSSYQKIIHEGTLLILHEGKVYNVIGIQIK